MPDEVARLIKAELSTLTTEELQIRLSIRQEQEIIYVNTPVLLEIICRDIEAIKAEWKSRSQQLKKRLHLRVVPDPE